MKKIAIPPPTRINTPKTISTIASGLTPDSALSLFPSAAAVELSEVILTEASSDTVVESVELFSTTVLASVLTSDTVILDDGLAVLVDELVVLDDGLVVVDDGLTVLDDGLVVLDDGLVVELSEGVTGLPGSASALLTT